MAKGLDWFKVASNISHDDDLEHVSDPAFRTFIELIGIATENLSDGVVTISVARKLCGSRRFAAAIKELQSRGFVDVIDATVVIRAYEKHQQSRAKTEEIRESTLDRVTRYRERCNGVSNDVSNGGCNDTRVRVREREEDNTANEASPEFDSFWEVYPRRVQKGRARTAFKTAAKKVGADQVLATIKEQLPQLESRDEQFIPHPASWLNGEPWHDEQPPASAEEQEFDLSSLDL